MQDSSNIINQNFVDKANTESLQEFMVGVFTAMASALCLSGVVAMLVASSSLALNLIFSSPIVFYGLLILELLMVWFLSARIQKLSLSAARFGFFVYAFVNGLTLSVIFFTFTSASIASVFFVCAGIFAAMACYGYYTKKDLSSWGSLLFMLLIGLILASLINLFLLSSKMDLILSYIGVVIFVGLTAYDTQKIKNLHNSHSTDPALVQKLSILGALTLYLDFINLFLKLLRILGKRK